MQWPAVEKAEATIDWLTLTIKEGMAREYVKESARSYLLAQERDGEDIIKWYGLGYQGLAVPGFSWGERGDSDIIKLTGYHADILMSRFTRYNMRCTRVDLAVTVRFVEAAKNVASRLWTKITVEQEPDPRRVVSLVTSTKGGQTLYMGSRSSDQYLRLYDKGAESGTALEGVLWRWEVEYKGERAPIVWERLTSARNRSTMIAATVAAYCDKRHIPVPWKPGKEVINAQVHTAPKTVEAQLAWLRSQVRGTVQRLRAKGYSRAVDDALGIGGE